MNMFKNYLWRVVELPNNISIMKCLIQFLLSKDNKKRQPKHFDMMKTLLKLGFMATRNFLFSQTQRQMKRLIMLSLIVFLPSGLFAQTEPEFIQNWTFLEEAEFHFDVSYAVVKCNPVADPVVIMNAFNEGGGYAKVGFTLAISDDAGNTAEVEIPLFATKLGDMFIASCESDDHSNLRFAIPAGIDAATMKMAITYNTGS
jgi:hypothetical protein